MKKVIAIHLDAYEPSLGLEMMEAGEMPSFRELACRSARFELDHGTALRTGLAAEHVATGLSPIHAKRWAAVHFNPNTYDAWQEGTYTPPFCAKLPIRTVVFDSPYFDLENVPNVKGIVNWGAHDPGVDSMSRPAELLGEVIQKFGEYPAKQWLYGLSWNSVEKAQQASNSLFNAISTRAEIAEWLLKERIKEWDLALISVSESHSGIEGLWHGIDPNHPLHQSPTARISGQGVRNIYKGIDKLVGRLMAINDDAVVILFSMHGMGPNRGDPASLLLLAELIYRHVYGVALFNREGESSVELNQRVNLPTTESWGQWVQAGFPKQNVVPKSKLWGIASSFTPKFLKHHYRVIKDQATKNPVNSGHYSSLDWNPTMRYQPFWREMPAFAIPSFYDGRVRINLKGREKCGIVPIDQYNKIRDEFVRLVSECKDPITGHGVVQNVEFPICNDPIEMNETEADIVFVWNGAPTGFLHTDYGKIGPIPYRRTGGHTGGNGFAYITGTNLSPGDYGTRSAYDVVATLPDIFELSHEMHISGTSLLTPNF